MNRFPFKLTLALLTLALWPLAAMAQPKARWIESSHDFGAFDEDMGPVSCQFYVVNDGTEPLVILSARATCGCTVPRYTRTPINPGDSAAVDVTYNPAARPGKFDKKVKVKTNASSADEILTIRGVVIGSLHTLRAHYPVEVGRLKLKARTVPFGDMRKGSTKTAFLDGYNQSQDTIYPVVEGLPPYIDVDVAPRAVPPGQQLTMTFFCNSARAADLWGFNEARATVSTGLGTPADTLSLLTIINEDFSRLTPEQLRRAPQIAVSDASIDLGRIAPDARPVKARITIDNFGSDPLIVRRVVCSSPVVTAKAKALKIKGGKQSYIEVTVDPSRLEAGADMVNERITIITNDPSHPSSSVRIVGEVGK